MSNREELIDAAESAMDNVHDMDVTFRQYAEAATDAIIATLDTDALVCAALELAAETVEECEGVNFGIRDLSDDDEAKAAIMQKAGWAV